MSKQVFNSKNLGAEPVHRLESSLGPQDYRNKKPTARHQSSTLNHRHNRTIWHNSAS